MIAHWPAQIGRVQAAVVVGAAAAILREIRAVRAAVARDGSAREGAERDRGKSRGYGIASFPARMMRPVCIRKKASC